jgi:uncharacterized protein (DUF2252 family)
MTDHADLTDPTADPHGRGRAARARAPRGAHGSWARPAGVDPVALLELDDVSRTPSLVPIRHGRMATSEFAFFRGSAAIMAADLAETPTMGVTAQLCGDAHLSNFGVFATPERQLIFDVNDFDETLRGPWEWDVKRLATSAVIAAREIGLTTIEGGAAADEAVRSYRTAMLGFAAMTELEVWYLRVNVDELMAQLAGSVSKSALAKASKGVAKARRRTSSQAASKLTEVVDGRLRIVADPPLIVPLRTVVDRTGAAQMRDGVEELYGTYRESLPDHQRYLLDRYEILDVAHKVVGVGSVGTRALIVALRGRSDADVLMLQLKEASTSVLENYLASSPYELPARRVVEGQRMMQAASDAFLGWSSSSFDGRSYYWRQLRDMKGSADVSAMSAPELQIHSRICGWTLARAHARSIDSRVVAGYLGKGRRFDEAVVAFAHRYADQNAADFEAHRQAIADGRIPVHAGV